MRSKLLVGLLSIALIAISTFPLANSDAARRAAQPQDAPTTGRARGASRPTLPNYDIRLVGRGEFTDIDLTTTASTESAARSANGPLQTRATAIDNFRATLRPEVADNLRATINEAGAMKNFFVDGAPLSAPQDGAPDSIARDFLRQHGALFSLTDAAVAEPQAQQRRQ